MATAATIAGGGGAAAAPAAQHNRAAPCNLEGGPLDLRRVREEGRKELINILETYRGRKCLVLDTALGGLLGHIIPEGTKFLKQHGVVLLNKGLRTELNFSADGRMDDPDHVLYFVRPSVSNMKLIAQQIKQRKRKRPGGMDRSRGGYDLPDYRYRLFFVPHKTFLCEKMLEDEGVADVVDVGECQLDLFPLDTDLLSLELDSSFKEMYIDDDSTALTTVAKSLLKLQSVYGLIPNVKAKGSGARVALQRLMNLKKNMATQQHEDFDALARPPGIEIDSLVLLDRSVDLVTPLLTPLTFEGLIDEFVGIANGVVRIEPHLAGDEGVPAGLDASGGRSTRPSPSPGGSLSGSSSATGLLGGGRDKEEVTTIPVALNSNDPLYAEFRDLNIEGLGTQLQDRAKEIKAIYASFKTDRDASIEKIHHFVKSIPQLTQKYRGLNLYINIAELLKPTTDSVRFRHQWQVERCMVEGDGQYDYLEDMIAGYEPVTQVLRLLCLQSLTGGGIRVNKFDHLRREIVQTYGYEYMFALNNMEALGLLRRAEAINVFGSAGGAWATLRKSLRLIQDSVNTANPDDISYVSSGYAPLSVRLLQVAHSPGWSNCADVMRLLPGPTLEFVQRHEPQDLDRILRGLSPTPAAASEARPPPAGGGKKVMLVYFIGGMTYMELAAMRFLSKQRDFPYTIIACTTKMINGNTFVSSTSQDVQNMLRTSARRGGGAAR